MAIRQSRAAVIAAAFLVAVTVPVVIGATGASAAGDIDDPVQFEWTDAGDHYVGVLELTKMVWVLTATHKLILMHRTT